MSVRYGDSDGPFVVPHRAGAALATENTWEGAARSVALGHRYLETDARTTRDGVVVAFHDRTVTRLAGVPGEIAAMTWDQVRSMRLHGGGRVARLADLLATWPEVRWTVDVKDPATLPALVDVLTTTGATRRVCLAGTRDRWLTAARAGLGDGVSTALGWESIAALVAGGPFRLPPHTPRFVHLPWWLVRHAGVRGVVQRAHDAGLRTVVWGVDDAATMHHLLDRGVDGLISDRADTLREVLLARGRWVPAPLTPPRVAPGRRAPARPRP